MRSSIYTVTDLPVFLKRTEWILFIILLVMVGGYFTWSENVAITRLIKVVGRLGTTTAAWWVYRTVVERGAPASFRWRNIFSPLLYAAYLSLGFVSFLWSTDVGYSALQWFMDIEALVFAFFFMRTLMILDHWFPGNHIRFYNLMGNTAFVLLSVFVVGALAAPNTFFRLVEGGEDKRLGGYLMNPNELGMLCGLGISCLTFAVYDPKKRIWALIKIGAMMYVLIMTKSRSSLVGLLLILFFHLRRMKNKTLLYAIYAAVAAAIPVAVSKLILRKGGIDDVLSMTGRMPFWKALITEGLPREPLLGFGFMRIDYKDRFESVHTYAGHMTHNTFIQVLMNLGFVGLLLALVQVICTIRGFIKEKDDKKLMLLGIIIPVLINSFTEFGIFGETNYGILFFQLLIFSISLSPHRYLSKKEHILMTRKRPDLFPAVDQVSTPRKRTPSIAI